MYLSNKTKIVASIGPASISKQVLKEMIFAGMIVGNDLVINITSIPIKEKGRSNM